MKQTVEYYKDNRSSGDGVNGEIPMHASMTLCAN